MGKDKSEKKDKHEKKEKRAEKDGIHKSKKEKKEKKDKTALTNAVEQELTTKVLDGIDQAVAGEAATGDVQMVDGRPIGALVPFAQPLVEDKAAKKVLKSVKKAAVNKCLKRGVKEVVKALRKSAVPAPNEVIAIPGGVVILAGDISPMDVISHIPVLCEDHGIPYVFVSSRAELGNSAATKRPTSVVMAVPKSAAKGKKKDDAEDDGEDFSEVYEELVKVARKEAKKANI